LTDRGSAPERTALLAETAAMSKDLSDADNRNKLKDE
jgi:hypothetical protein